MSDAEHEDATDPLFVGDERSDDGGSNTGPTSGHESKAMGTAGSRLPVSSGQIAAAITGLLPGLLTPLAIEFQYFAAYVVMATAAIFILTVYGKWLDRLLPTLGPFVDLLTEHRSILLSGLLGGFVMGLAGATIARWTVGLLA